MIQPGKPPAGPAPYKPTVMQPMTASAQRTPPAPYRPAMSPPIMMPVRPGPAPYRPMAVQPRMAPAGRTQGAPPPYRPRMAHLVQPAMAALRAPTHVPLPLPVQRAVFGNASIQRKGSSTCCHSRLTMQTSPMPMRAAMPGLGAGVVQRVKCTVSQNGVELGEHQQGGGGVAGESHVEQRSWGKSAKAATGDGPILFKLDGPVCAGCTRWFETEMYKTANDLKVKLLVKVKYQDFEGQIEVTGEGTEWGLVSEKGFYDHANALAEERVKKEFEQKKVLKKVEESKKLAVQKSLPVNKKKSRFNDLGAKLDQKQNSDFFGGGGGGDADDSFM